VTEQQAGRFVGNRPTTWQMWAGERLGRDGMTRAIVHIGEHENFARYSGVKEPFEVCVTEVPEGEHTHVGWMRSKSARGDGIPTLIYERIQALQICMPYGIEAEVEAGHGRVIYLKIERSAP
jgi:hypothetical protein